MTMTSIIETQPGDNLEFEIGKKGGNGVGYQGSAAGGVGGNGYSNGGNGGRAGSTGSSGGGGGGGGSSMTRYNYATGGSIIGMIAAGGSGAGGRGNQSHYSEAEIHGKNATQIQTALANNANGGNGINCPCADGGAGGGGGAGITPAANGGLYYGNTTSCIHYDSDGLPGEAGISYHVSTFNVTTNNDNTGDGYISISW